MSPARPLEGLRVVVTRAANQAEGLVAALLAEGADPLCFPVIEATAPPDLGPLDAAVRAAGEGAYGAVLLTSQNAVRAVLASLARQGLDAGALGRGARVCAVGPATARALTEAGVEGVVVAREHVGEGLLPELVALFPKREARPRVLLPRAERARDAVPEGLRAAGFSLDVVTAYVTRGVAPAGARELLAELEGGRVGAITFTSSSTVTHFFEALQGAAAADADANARSRGDATGCAASEDGGARVRLALAGPALASIGPLTTATAEALGLAVTLTAPVHTTDGLLAALRGHFARR